MSTVDLEAIKQRLAAATPGPWYVHNPDDALCMNAYCVSTDEHEPWIDMPESKNGHEHIIAITLLQSPRVVCHASEKWEENAELIAHIPTDMAALIAEVERLRVIEQAVLNKDLDYEDSLAIEVKRLRGALQVLAEDDYWHAEARDVMDSSQGYKTWWQYKDYDSVRDFVVAVLTDKEKCLSKDA